MALGESLKFDLASDPTSLIKALTQAADGYDRLEGKAREFGSTGKAVAAELSQTADSIAADMVKAERATSALGAALGPELVAKFEQGELGLQGVIDKLRSLGASFDDIEADADELAASIRKLDEVDPGKFGGATRQSASDVDKLSDSARGANSALANMVGNTAQDVGELGGISGSTGVAIGQMAEYMSDAKLAGEGLGSAVASMAKVLGPILVLSSAVGVVSGLLDEQRRKAEESKQRVDQFGDAMADAADDALGLADSLRQSNDQLSEFDVKAGDFGGLLRDNLADIGQQLPLIGGLFGGTAEQITNLIPIMDAAGFSMYDLAKAIENGGLVGDEWTDTLLAALDAGKITMDQYEALSQAITKYGDEASRSRQFQQLLNVDLEEANAILQSLRDPLAQYSDQWKTLKEDLLNGSIETEAAISAINTLAESLGLTQAEVIALAQSELPDFIARAVGSVDALAVSFDDVTAGVGGASAGIAQLGDDANSAADGLARAGSEMERLAGLQGLLSEEQAVLGLLNGWDRVLKAAGDYWAAQQDETADTEKAYRDYRSQLNQFAQEVIRYAQTVEDIPEQKVTDLVLALQDGDINEIQTRLADLTADRNIRIGLDMPDKAGPIKFVIDTSGGAPVLAGGNAGPTIVNTRPTASTPPPAFTPSDLDRILAAGGTSITNNYTIGQDPETTRAQQREYDLWDPR